MFLFSNRTQPFWYLTIFFSLPRSSKQRFHILGSPVTFKIVCRVCVLHHFGRVQLYVTLWAVAHQAPLSMGFSGQEYWSGSPRPPPGHLPGPGVNPVSLSSRSPASAGRFFTTSATICNTMFWILTLDKIIELSSNVKPFKCWKHSTFFKKITLWIKISCKDLKYSTCEIYAKHLQIVWLDLI